MQQADEAEAGRDVVHHRLRVHRLELVHDVRELERRLLLFRFPRRCWQPCPIRVLRFVLVYVCYRLIMEPR